PLRAGCVQWQPPQLVPPPAPASRNRLRLCRRVRPLHGIASPSNRTPHRCAPRRSPAFPPDRPSIHLHSHATRTHRAPWLVPHPGRTRAGVLPSLPPLLNDQQIIRLTGECQVIFFSDRQRFVITEFDMTASDHSGAAPASGIGARRGAALALL